MIMKRFYLKFRIALMTLALGLASVFFMNSSLRIKDEIAVDLPQVESTDVFEIITKEKWQGFAPVAHGCGGRNKYGGEGTVTSFQNNSFVKVWQEYSSYSNSKALQRKIELRIKNSANVLERVEDKSFEKRRLVLENIQDNEKWYEIITYENPKLIKIIGSRKLELAIEFEKLEAMNLLGF